MGVYRDASELPSAKDSGRACPLQTGKRIFRNLTSASKDPAAFPNPNKVDLTRDVNVYVHFDTGSSQFLSSEFRWTGLIAMPRTVGRLDNLRKAPGPQGDCKRIAGPYGTEPYTTDDQRSSTSFPNCMNINWDGSLLPIKQN